MKPWVKWTATVAGAALLLATAAAVAGYQMAQSRMTRTVEAKVAALPYAEGADALQRGKYLFESRGCADCHGAGGGGRVFVSEGNGLKLAGPNITPGGVVARYQPVDWVRIIRHGIKGNGQPAMIMPSEDYNRFTDPDLAALVAYVRSLPPTTGGDAILELPLPARVLYGFGAIKDSAAKIDHTLAPAQPVPVAADAKHGAYVANMCIGCHGAQLSGGKIPGGPPDWPAAANLTPGEGSAMPRYKDSAAFITMLRTGLRPDGSRIRVMPFESLGKLNDVDAQALHAFLQSVPARAAGGR